MSGKGKGGYVNLLQKLAVALTHGKAEVEVHYVPVSRDPYVEVAFGDDFDAMEAIRNSIVVSLAERGFRRADATSMVRETDRGHFYIDVGTPGYDAGKRVAVISLRSSGPYGVAQSLGSLTRDVAGERRAFQAAVERQRHDARIREDGARAVVRMLLFGAPFKVPVEDVQRIVDDGEVRARVAKAFAGQGLATMDDLVEAANLREVLGREPAATTPAP